MMPPARGLLNADSAVFLIDAASCPHDDELVLLELLHGQHRRDLLALFHRDEVGDRLAFAAGSDVGDFVDLEPVGAAAIREDHDVGVRRGDEQVADEVLVARAHADAALAAAALVPVGRNRGALDVAGVGDGDRHVLLGDQVFDAQLARRALDDLRAAVVAVLRPHRAQLVDDDLHQQPFAGENGAAAARSS